MAMRIIKRGDEKLQTCGCCGTDFAYVRKDVVKIEVRLFDMINTEMNGVVCPVCGEKILVSPEPKKKIEL